MARSVHNAPGRMKRLFAILAFFPLLSCQGTEGALLVFEDASVGGAGGDSGVEPEGLHRARLRQLTSFQIQLSGQVDLGVEAELFVVDANSPDTATFDGLDDAGAYVACYFSAGSLEPWRPDFDAFPAAVVGDPLPDYPNENWLDVRSETVVTLMTERIQSAGERGCAGVYPAIPRPAMSDEGFALVDDDFTTYAERLAAAAHELGLGAVHAAGPGFAPEATFFDATLVFGCGVAGLCDSWGPHAQAGYGIFLVEFGDEVAPEASCVSGIDWPQIVKNQGLDSFRYVCP
jgi:hypothetical protein